MRILSFVLVSALCVSQAVGQKPAPEKDRKLLFNSGFESGSVVVPLKPGSSDDDIYGKDLSVGEPNDWTALDYSPYLCNFYIQYEGGDTTQRYARIIDDPTKPGNKVLYFWLGQPNVTPNADKRLFKPKARIQGNFYYGQKEAAQEGLKELYQSVRIYLHPDLEVIRRMPEAFTWFTLMEWWNNRAWSNTPYPFRMSFGLCKKSVEDSDIYFHLRASNYEYLPESTKVNGKFIKCWDGDNTDIKVPFGKWFTIEYYIKDGDKDSGRFYMTFTPEGGKTEVLYDIKGDTHGIGNPNPSGIKMWHPMKMYTSDRLVNFMMGEGKEIKIYWDDLKVWTSK